MYFDIRASLNVPKISSEVTGHCLQATVIQMKTENFQINELIQPNKKNVKESTLNP